MDVSMTAPAFRSKANASPISTEEQTRRRQAVAQAHAHNRIEGIPTDPSAEPIFEAFINGEIDIDELGRHIDALPLPH
ncbi:MAG: antitoxin VbhA family protein [Beijerinckiaceae bacterium]